MEENVMEETQGIEPEVVLDEQVEVTEEPQVEVEAEASVETEEVPEYVPDYTYKAMGEEREIPEFARAAITSKEQEDQLKEIFSKAGGMEHFEKKYGELNQRITDHFDPLEKKYTDQNAALDMVQQMVTEKNWDKFHKTFNISEDDIIEHARRLVEYKELPPETRAQVDQYRNTMDQNQELNSQNQAFQTQLRNQAIATRTMQLDMELTKPEVSSFVEQYDRIRGVPGAFRQQVIKEGAYAWNANKVDVPVDQLVSQVMGDYGNFVNQQNIQHQPQPTTTAAGNTKPVIPNVQGGSQSPVKQQITSLNDLIERRKALEGLD